MASTAACFNPFVSADPKALCAIIANLMQMQPAHAFGSSLHRAYKAKLEAMDIPCYEMPIRSGPCGPDEPADFTEALAGMLLDEFRVSGCSGPLMQEAAKALLSEPSEIPLRAAVVGLGLCAGPFDSAAVFEFLDAVAAKKLSKQLLASCSPCPGARSSKSL